MTGPIKDSGLLQLAQRIAREGRVTVTDMLGRSKLRSVVRARHRFCAVVRSSLGLSYPEIGRLIGRDHTTVMNAVKQYEDELAREYSDG